MAPSPSRENQSGLSIQVLARATRLLDELAASTHPLSLRDLALKTELHPSTAHRILNDLVATRYVKRTDTGGYQLGMRLLELGSLVRERLDVRDLASEAMQTLHMLTGQTVNLSVRENDEIVYIDRAWNERSGMQVVRAIGGRAPLHLTSTGKLFLSSMDARQVRAYVSRTGLPGTTSNSCTDSEALEKEIAFVRREGYARDLEELENGVCCIAASVRDDTGQIVAGLSISAPVDRMRDDWAQKLQTHAADISRALGYGTRRTRQKP